VGVAIALGFSALFAVPVRAGFTSLQAPSPTQTLPSNTKAGTDFTPRCDAPTLDLDNGNASATAVDLPDAWDLRHGKPGGDDRLITNLTGDRSKTNYSQFWEDTTHPNAGDQFSDFGVDVKSSVPVVVPLPQGVWAGLIGLAFVIVLQIRRQRRQLI
jgi:hypothetical protein